MLVEPTKRIRDFITFYHVAYPGVLEERRRLSIGIREVTIRLRLGLEVGVYKLSNRINTRQEMLTVDHKDICTSIRQTRNVQEMNMVLRNGHHRLVICAQVQLLNVIPRDGCRVGRFEKAHVQGIEILRGERI